jgi:hypothetical protein
VKEFYDIAGALHLRWPAVPAMSLEVEATYENGVLKLDQPLPFAEQER